jgi:5-methylcytosine-specific restriction endonuclease McrA
MELTLAQLVRERAHNLCEYCQMPQALSAAPFELDHIISKQHGGHTGANNLALACLSCNGHKGPNIASLDPKTRKLTPLFNP